MGRLGLGQTIEVFIARMANWDSSWHCCGHVRQLWPKARTLEMFHDRFDVQTHAVIEDPCPEPVIDHRE